jgi:hypothetical protein
MVDEAKIRRESIRWYILLTLNNASPYGSFYEALLAVIQAMYGDATQKELYKEMDYLATRDLITLDKKPDGRWHGKLTRYGTDIAEYTIDCEAGIARPEKYW